MECRKPCILETCNCSYEPCPRKGMCCLCIEHHRDQGELPACYFKTEDERTHNRTIEFFIKTHSH